MTYLADDIRTVEGRFPRPPVKASNFLVPITTWPDIFHEAKITGITFDEFWYDSVEEGVAYFFRWLGEPRSTILVIWQDEGPTHIEGYKRKYIPLSEDELEPIVAEVTMLFRNAGLRPNHLLQ